MFTTVSTNLIIAIMCIGVVVCQDPADFCEAEDDVVCLTCHATSTCQGTGAPFTVDEISSVDCGDGEVCLNTGDMACATPGQFSTACVCTDANINNLECKKDPNNDRAFIDCSATTIVSQLCEEGETVDFENCSCSTGSTTECICGYKEDLDETTCDGFLYCEDNSNAHGKCLGDYCFNAENCLCDMVDPNET